MVLAFLKRKSSPGPAAPAAKAPPKASMVMPEEVVAQEHQLKLYYAGKSSDGVRMNSGPKAVAEFPKMLVGLATFERPVPAAGRGGLVCAHCGFASAHERAFYCPKCGMRLLRG